MARSTISFKGFLADFSILIHPKIFREPTREALIGLHCILSSDATYVVSTVCRGSHSHLALTMATDDYLSQKYHAFYPPHKPGE